MKKNKTQFKKLNGSKAMPRILTTSDLDSVEGREAPPPPPEADPPVIKY